MIDYNVVNLAIEFYKKHGYQYVEVPWIVSDKAYSITAPSVLKPLILDREEPKQHVASGEQSFMELILQDKLKIGRYCCATPCYRPNDNFNDGLHFPYFFKVELIDYLKHDVPLNSFKQVDFILDMRKLARRFMEFIRHDSLIDRDYIEDEQRHGCKSLYAFDLETKNSIELGSYGLRYSGLPTDNDTIGYWIYGTGVALPRIYYGMEK